MGYNAGSLHGIAIQIPHGLSIMLTLQSIIRDLSGQHLAGETPVTAVAIDSRDVTPGALFVALPGEHADGHTYVADAFTRGARAALVRQPVEGGWPALDLHSSATLPTSLPEGPLLLVVDDPLAALQWIAQVYYASWASSPQHRSIAITGSVGKTTTKEAAAALLAERYLVLKSDKSYNNEIGVPLTALRLTPQHERAVIEMSMYYPGEIRMLCGITPPDIGIVTLVAPVHLERAGTLQAIIDAKAELVEALGPDGAAVLNGDDANVLGMANRTRARVITFGLGDHVNVRATGVESLALEGVRFTLNYRGESRPVHVPQPGRFQVMTALAAAAAGFVEDMTWDEIVRGLEKPRESIRLVVLDGPRGSTILDDTYNASPDSVVAALDLLGDLRAGRRVAVLGDMLELGDYEVEGHMRVGRHAAAIVDMLLTVGERGLVIADAARRAGLAPECVRSFDSADEAAACLVPDLDAGDAVLIKGSRAVGMERVVQGLLGAQGA